MSKRLHFAFVTGWAVLFASLASGQNLQVNTDTTTTSTQSYYAVLITNNATLTLSGSDWKVGGGTFYVGTNDTKGSRGHLAVTNGAMLNFTGSSFTVMSPSLALTSTVTIVNGTLAAASTLAMGGGGFGATWLYVGQGGVLSNGFTIQHGKALIEAGARLTIPNQSIRTSMDNSDGNAELTIRGSTTRVMQGTSSAASMNIGRKGYSKALITDGAVVTNFSTFIADCGYAYVPMGSTTGRLTVAGGARLYGSSSITVGSKGGGGIGDNGGVGFLTVTDPDSFAEAVSCSVYGTNETYQGTLLVTSQATLRVSSSLTVGNGSLTVNAGGILDVPGSQMSILAGTCGVITNYGGAIVLGSYLPSFKIYLNGTTNRVVTHNGTVGFRARNDANVYFHTQGAFTNMAFLGVNAFMLDAAKNISAGYTNQSYLFDTGLGASNFYKLILKNGATYQGGTATIGAGGRMELSGSGLTNTLAEICTNWGKVTLFSGNVKFTKSLLNYGLLEGAGRVEGGMTNYSGSTVAPGGTNGFGTLSLTNLNLFLPGATLACQFGGASAGQFDVLALDAGATLKITDSTLAGELRYAPVPGQTWTIVDNRGGTLTGTFTNTRFWSAYNGKNYRFDILYNAGDGNDVAVRCSLPSGILMLVR